MKSVHDIEIHRHCAGRWFVDPGAHTTLYEIQRACQLLNLRPHVTPGFQVFMTLAEDYEGEPPTGDAIAQALWPMADVIDLPALLRRQAE